MRQFQFHKGAIKTEPCEHLYRRPSDFNSIKVRLKHPDRSIDAMLLRFQFHKGAIKTGGGRHDRIGQKQFQFHKGAIKTNKRHLSSTVLSYFNSIKVRLKPGKRG